MFKIILLIGILTTSCTPQIMKKEETQSPVSQVTQQEILISDEYKVCNQDSDCQMVSKLCLCCKLEAINKIHAQKYLDQEKDCIELPPPCGCADSRKNPKCINNKCELI